MESIIFAEKDETVRDFLLACYYGNSMIVEELYTKVNIDSSVMAGDTEDGYVFAHSAIFLATLMGHHDIVNFLLGAGAETSLCAEAIAKRDDASMAQLYFQKGALILSELGDFAVLHDAPNVATWLYSNGGNMHHHLPFAVRFKKDNVAEILLRNGAEVTFEVLHDALSRKDGFVRRIPLTYLTVNQDPSPANEYTVLPTLLHAADMGNADDVDYLLRHGANVSKEFDSLIFAFTATEYARTPYIMEMIAHCRMARRYATETSAFNLIGFLLNVFNPVEGFEPYTSERKRGVSGLLCAASERSFWMNFGLDCREYTTPTYVPPVVQWKPFLSDAAKMELDDWVNAVLSDEKGLYACLHHGMEPFDALTLKSIDGGGGPASSFLTEYLVMPGSRLRAYLRSIA